MRELVEAAQPWAIWRQLYKNIYDSFMGALDSYDSKSLEPSVSQMNTKPFLLVEYILTKFGLPESEVLFVHYPAILFASLSFVFVSI